MKQEDKDLLLKDLCARLPYDVKCKIEMWIGYDVCTIYNINSIGYVEIVEDANTNGVSIERVKPYLFPLSSMSDEIIDEIYNNAGVYDICVDSPVHIEVGTKFEDLAKIFDILHKYHIDYQNLIEKGLAIDATNLNIY